MAAHRKPKQRPLTGPAARTAATLAIATAASATAFEGVGHAEPNLSPAQVKAKVDKLYQEAEVAGEAYNGAKQKTQATEKTLSSLQDEAARKTETLNAARQQIGQSAAAQYRTGGIDPTVQVLLSSNPAQFLDRASLVDQLGTRQTADLADVEHQMGRIDQLRTTADGRLAQLRTQQADLKKHKAEVQAKIRDAQALLDRLSAPERSRYESGDAPAGGTSIAPTGTTVGVPIKLTSNDPYARWQEANVVRGVAKGTISVMAYARLGDITTKQWRDLADIQRDFNLDVRVTNRQNFALRDVTEADLRGVYDRLIDTGMAEPGAELARDVLRG